ncbi:MAG: cupin domain-containing protein [Planctomycetes bacterium]|jgi:quercetin dioxygenase-like cupin family protein|nr:cupin domain-containing protein [Planctomycetota bacterium]
MHIFPRKEKSTPEQYYFGEYTDKPLAPFSVSVANFDVSFTGEKAHYHKVNQKVFITISGKGILNVNNNKIELVEEQMIQIEPGEIHFIEKVIEAPLKIIVINSAKIDDKVVVE